MVLNIAHFTDTDQLWFSFFVYDAWPRQHAIFAVIGGSTDHQSREALRVDTDWYK